MSATGYDESFGIELTRGSINNALNGLDMPPTVAKAQRLEDQWATCVEIDNALMARARAHKLTYDESVLLKAMDCGASTAKKFMDKRAGHE